MSLCPSMQPSQNCRHISKVAADALLKTLKICKWTFFFKIDKLWVAFCASLFFVLWRKWTHDLIKRNPLWSIFACIVLSVKEKLDYKKKLPLLSVMVSGHAIQPSGCLFERYWAEEAWISYNFRFRQLAVDGDGIFVCTLFSVATCNAGLSRNAATKT
jgi:hypothetical protein